MEQPAVDNSQTDSPSQPSSTNDPAGPSKPKKQRRSTRACDFCHRRSIRCRPSVEASRCQNCVDFDVPCTYDRPAKKRGVKAAGAAKDSPPSLDSAQHANLLLQLTNENSNARDRAPEKVQPDALVHFALESAHREMALANPEKIAGLVNVYFEVVYPIFPLFHRKTLLQKIASREYLKNQALFCAVMSICALASSRARDGALPPGHWDPSYFQHPSAELFFAAVKDVLPPDLASLRSFDYMRSCGLLALYGIQLGKSDIMHQYLGLYHTLVAIGGTHDEKNWPETIGLVEREERRRLFWSIYTLEVYCSIVWGSVLRCRESQSRVAYPSEVDDDFFSDEGFTNRPAGKSSTVTDHRLGLTSRINVSCWLHGWNFTTELYRVLEHAINDAPRRRPRNAEIHPPADLFPKDAASRSEVLGKVMSMYAGLPSRFKETRNAVSIFSEDIFSFQAANIATTLQLARMVLFTAEDATVAQKCAIAKELLDGFSKVPFHFLRAISSPMAHQLAGIGAILGSVVEGPLSGNSYFQVRNILLPMVDLLNNLKIGITRTTGAVPRIRNFIRRVDEFMVAQRQPDFSYPPLPSHLHHYQQPAASTSQVNHHISTAMPQIPVSTSKRASPPNPNVDPALQDLPHPAQPASQWNQQIPRQESYTLPVHSTNLGSDGVRWDSMRSHDDQVQFHIPPEILEDWPWGFDITRGFGAST